jgi:hypothetical protein
VARRALLRGVVSAQGQRWTGGTEWAGRPLRAGEPICPLTGYDWNYRTSKQLQLSDRELYLPVARPFAVRHRSTGRQGHVGTALTGTAGRKAVRAGLLMRCCRTNGPWFGPQRLRGDIMPPSVNILSPVRQT